MPKKINYKDFASVIRQEQDYSGSSLPDKSLVFKFLEENPNYKSKVEVDYSDPNPIRTGNLEADIKAFNEQGGNRNPYYGYQRKDNPGKEVFVPSPKLVNPFREERATYAPQFKLNTNSTGGVFFQEDESKRPSWVDREEEERKRLEPFEFAPIKPTKTLEYRRFQKEYDLSGNETPEELIERITKGQRESSFGSGSERARMSAINIANKIISAQDEDNFNKKYPNSPLSLSQVREMSQDQSFIGEYSSLSEQLNDLYGKIKYNEALGNEGRYNELVGEYNNLIKNKEERFGDFDVSLKAASPYLGESSRSSRLNEIASPVFKEAKEKQESYRNSMGFLGKASTAITRFVGGGLGVISADLLSSLGATETADDMKTFLSDNYYLTKDSNYSLFETPYNYKTGEYKDGLLSANTAGFMFEQLLNMTPAIAAYSTPYGRAAKAGLAMLGTAAATYDDYSNEIDQAALEAGVRVDPQTRALLASAGALKTGIIENIIPIDRYLKVGLIGAGTKSAIKSLASGKGLGFAMRQIGAGSVAFLNAEGIEIGEEIIDAETQSVIDRFISRNIEGINRSEAYADPSVSNEELFGIIVNTAIAVAPLGGVSSVAAGYNFKNDLFHHVASMGKADQVLSLFEQNKDNFKGDSFKKNTDRLSQIRDVYEAIPTEFDATSRRKIADNMLEINRLDGQLKPRTPSSQRETIEKKITKLQNEIDAIYQKEQGRAAPTSPQMAPAETSVPTELQVSESDQNVLNVVSERIEPILNPLTQRMTNAEEIDMAEIEAVAEQMIDEQARILESETLSEEEKQSLSQLIELQIDNILSYEFATITTTEQAGEKTKTAGLVATPREGRPLPESVVSRDRFDGAGVRVGGKGAGRITVKRLPGFGGRSVYGVSFGNRKGVTPIEDLEFDNLEFVAPEVLGDGSLNVRVRDSKSGLEFTITDPELSMDLAIAAQLKEAGRKEFPQPAFLEAVREVTQGQPTQVTTFPNLGRTGTTPAAVGVEPQTEQDVRQETNAPQEGRGQGEDAAPVPQEEGRQEGQVTPPAVVQEGKTPPATAKKPRKTAQEKADERKTIEESLKEALRALKAKQEGKEKAKRRIEENQEEKPRISQSDFERISKRLNKVFKGSVKIVDAETFQKEAEKTTGEKIDLKSKDGTLYGAVLPNGVMFIDESKLSANTLLHEHTHLFNQIVMSADPKLWSAIKDAVKKTDEWGKVKNNKSYSNLTTDDQIADEVFSRIVGNAAENGWQKYTDKPIYKKIKDLAQKFYNTILKAFGVDFYEGMSAGALADLTLNELLGGISTTPYQIDAKINGLISQLFRGTKYFNQARFSLDPNSRKKFEKALKEKDGRALYDIFGNVADPEKLIQWAKDKFPIRGSLATMSKLQNNDYENFGSTVIYNEFQKLLNEELKKSIDKAKLEPSDLLRTIGYTLFNPKNLKDARDQFLHYYKNGKNICTLNPGSPRFQTYFVTFIVKDDAAITPMADELTQDNLTPAWKEYLEKQKRKNDDGTYDLTGLKRDPLDPYSTSVISLQINKSNGEVKEISRYNHQLDSSPDNIFSRDFNKIIAGLEDAMFQKFGIEKNAKQAKSELPFGIIQDAEGRFFDYIFEENGVYYGDSFYIRNGVTTRLNKDSERMVDGFVINANGEVKDIVYETNEDPLAMDYRRKDFIYGDVKKVNYIRGNEISITTNNGDFVFETKKGAVVKLIEFPKAWREKFFERKGIDYSYDKNGDLTLGYMTSEEIHPYLNMFWSDNIVGVKKIILQRSKMQSLGRLRYIESSSAILKYTHIESLGELEFVGMSIDIEDSRVRDLGKLRYIGNNAYFDNTIIRDLGELKYIGGTAYIGKTEIRDLGKLEYIGNDVRFTETQLESLGKLKYVGGDLGISIGNYNLASLGKLAYVGGGVNIYSQNDLRSLGKVKYIGESLKLRNTQIRDLGDLEYVGGPIYITDQGINSVGRLMYVAGNAFIEYGPITDSDIGRINDAWNNNEIDEEKKREVLDFQEAGSRVKEKIYESKITRREDAYFLKIDETLDQFFSELNEAIGEETVIETDQELAEKAQVQSEVKPEKTIAEQRKEFRETAKKYFEGMKKMGVIFDAERNAAEDIAFIKALTKYIKLEIENGMVTFKGFVEKTAGMIEDFNDASVKRIARDIWSKEVVKAYPKIYAKLQKAQKALLDKELVEARKELRINLKNLLSDKKIFKQISSLTTERKLDKSSSDILVGIRSEIEALGGIGKLSDEQLISYSELATETYKEGRINQKQFIDALAKEKAETSKNAKSAITNQGERSAFKLKDAEEAREFLAENNGDNSNQVNINNGEVIVESVDDFDAILPLIGKGATFGGTTTSPNPNNVKRGKKNFFRTTLGGGLIYLLDKFKGKKASQETIDFFNNLQEEVKAGTRQKKRLKATLNNQRKVAIERIFRGQARYIAFMLSMPKVNGKRLVIKDNNGKEIKRINVAGVLYYYQLMKDPHFLKKDGNGERKIGLSESSMKDIVDFINLPENAKVRELINIDQLLIKKAAQNAAQVMEANNISSELFTPRTLDLSKYENDTFIGEILNKIYNNAVPSEIEYFPSNVESDANSQVPEVDALLDQEMDTNAVSAMSRFMIERVSGGKVRIKSYDAQLGEYFDSMSNTASKLPILKRFQAVFNKENSNLISSYYGKNTTDELRENIGRYITSRQQDSGLAKYISSGPFSKWLASGLGVQMVFAFTSAFSQLSSTPGPILSYGVKNYLDGLLMLTSGEVNARRAIVDLTDGSLFRERFGSRIEVADIVKAIPSDETGFASYVNEINKKLISIGAIPSSAFDALSIILSLPIYAREYSNALKTMTRKEAADYAENVLMDKAENFLQSKSDEMMSSFESKHRTTLYAFATVVPQLQRQAIMAFKRIQRGEGDLAQNINVLVWSGIGSSVAFRLLRPYFESLFEGDDDDEELKKLRDDKRLKRTTIDLAVDATKSLGTWGAISAGVLKTAYQLAEAEGDASVARRALDITPEVLEFVPAVSIKVSSINNAIKSYYDDEDLRGTTQAIQALTNIPAEKARGLAVQMSDAFLIDQFTLGERLTRLAGFVSENKAKEKIYQKSISTNPEMRELLSPSEIQRFESKQKSEYKSATSVIAKQYSEATTQQDRDVAMSKLFSLQASTTKYSAKESGELIQQIQDDFDNKVVENSLPEGFLEIKRMPSTKKVNFVANEFNKIKDTDEALSYVESLYMYGVISENERGEVFDILLQTKTKQ